MNSIIKELEDIANSDDFRIPQDCTANEVSGIICSILDQLVLEDDKQCDLLEKWNDHIGRLRCDIIGEHDWTYDMCGYWGHQYCVNCQTPKYPHLNALRCSEVRNNIGNISEEVYINQTNQNTTET